MAQAPDKVEDDDDEKAPAKGDRGDDFESTDEDADKDVEIAEEEEKPAGKGKDGVEEKGDEKADDELETEEKAEKPRGKDGKFVSHMVPTARLAEVTKKAELALQQRDERIRELERNQKSVDAQKDAAALDTEIAALETALEEARVDGNKERAAQLSRDIRLKERQVNLIETRTMSAQARESAREDMRYEVALEQLLIKYPVLDDKNEAHDKVLEDEVIELMTGFQRNGLKPAAALAKAMVYMEPRLKATLGEEEAPAKKGDRNQKQVGKNIDAAKKIPASLGQKGADSDKKGVSEVKAFEKMTDEERDALPESTRARLRGDYVE